MDWPVTSNFGQIEDRFESTGERPEKLVAMSNGQKEDTAHNVNFPMTQLNDNT